MGVAAGDESPLLSASVGSEVLVLNVTEESNMFTGETTPTEERIALPQIADPIKAVIVEPRQQWLYVINLPRHRGCIQPAQQAAAGPL